MILDREKIRPLRLKPGDIFAVKGKGPLSWALRHAIDPPTDRFHYGIVWMAADGGRDRVILESIGEGEKLETKLDILLYITIERGTVGQAISLNRLSSLHGKDVRFFRPRYIDEDIRTRVPVELTCYSKESYGYWFIARLAVSWLRKWLEVLLRERRFRKVHVNELPYVEPTKALVCTLAPDIGYALVGEQILPMGMVGTPNAYEQAVRDGVLEELHKEEDK